MTVRKLMASLCAATVCAAFAEMTVNESVTLDGDADWRDRGMVTIASGVTVDLNGHRLFTAGVSGDGTVVSGNPNGYRFYRFKVDATGGTYCQISAIHLYSGDSDITGQRTAFHWRQDNFNENFKSGYNPGMALDGDLATKWVDDRSKDDIWVTVEYEAPVFVTRYNWYTGNDTQRYPDRNPTAWRLQASNDNVAWTDLDVVTGATPPAANKTLAYGGLVNFNLCGDGGYRFYRFKVDVLGGKDFQISAIHLYSGDSDITGQRTAFHWRQDNFNENFKSGYNPGMALDGNTATKWFDDRAANDIWVTVEYEAPVFVTRYDWYTANDTSNHQWRNPTAWRLQASNDNMAWTDLDVVTGATPPTANKTLAYAGHVNSNPGGDCGELHIEVAEGTCQTNSTVTLSGRLKLVKDGAGTLVCAKTGQTYFGGTVVTSGTLKPAANSNVYSTQAFGGMGAVLTATTNETSVGTFDMNGVVGMRDIGYVVKLAGGTLKSSSRDIANSSGQMGHIALEADSTFAVDRTCALGVPYPYPTRLDLGGKTLTMNIASGKTFTMSATTVDEGVLVANGPGTLHFGNAYSKAIGIAATNAHFRVNCPISTELNDGVGVDVGTYEALYSGTANGGANPLRVFGTFKPSAHDCFRGCTLMDGATLDLSSRTNALPLVSGFASGANTLAFADGATISVRLGDGRFPGGKVISWEAGSAPGNVDTLKFMGVGGERKRHFAVKDDGLYAHVGFMLVIR